MVEHVHLICSVFSCIHFPSLLNWFIVQDSSLFCLGEMWKLTLNSRACGGRWEDCSGPFFSRKKTADYNPREQQPAWPMRHSFLLSAQWHSWLELMGIVVCNIRRAWGRGRANLVIHWEGYQSIEPTTKLWWTQILKWVLRILLWYIWNLERGWRRLMGEFL